MQMNPVGIRYDPGLDTNNGAVSASGPGGWVNITVGFNWPQSSMKSQLFYVSSKLVLGVLDNKNNIWFALEDGQKSFQFAAELPCVSLYTVFSSVAYVYDGSLTCVLPSSPILSSIASCRSRTTHPQTCSTWWERCPPL